MCDGLISYRAGGIDRVIRTLENVRDMIRSDGERLVDCGPRHVR